LSHLQDLTGEALRFWFPNERRFVDHRPAWLFGMELDFYFPDLALAIEVQGRQHKLWCPTMQPTVEDYQAQRRRDASKRRITHERGITLLCWKGFTGMQKSLRRACPGRKFPTLPADLRARMKQYRQVIHDAQKDKWVAVKVKGNGQQIGVNRPSAKFLRGTLPVP
jgi:hypothetical protein